MTPAGLPATKRLSHRLKGALYRARRFDSILDDMTASAPSGTRAWIRDRLVHRLLPERRVRTSPFALDGSPAPSSRHMLILTLAPPEDTGGASRPAQLAAELRRRGWSIDWRWALPIFPWPADRRPRIAGVEAHHVGEERPAGSATRTLDLVLLEAPHPALLAVARRAAAGAPLLYDAMDLWDGALGAGWYERAAEDEAIERADHLVASSRLLQAEIAARSARPVALLPNAVDPRRFDPRITHQRPGDVRRGKPTVVFIGALWGEWVDLDLIARLASSLPTATIHLIGPIGSRRLPAAANLFPLGPKPQAEIPAYLQAADVSIVPFAVNRLTAAVSPLKAFEAIAMRRPVVTTHLPELDRIPGVHVASGAQAFAAAVAAAPGLPWPTEAADLFASRHTWSARVDEMLRLARVPAVE